MGLIDSNLTLWSFSRLSAPSGMPLRLSGRYQKHTLVCWGWGATREHRFIQGRDEETRKEEGRNKNERK